uniref:Uncharacterized protein LOC100181918 n=1 Tax=Phallusia mammillata TaxID=59560 RepID=A0A6F9DIG4_9ASCI|nr:uncharacterized protein LOC100181918 [Phallusia mammillata]
MFRRIWIRACLLVFVIGFGSSFRISNFACKVKENSIQVTWSAIVQSGVDLNKTLSHYVISWYDLDSVTSPQYEGEDSNGKSVRHRLSGKLNGSNYEDYGNIIDNIQENVDYRVLKNTRSSYVIKELRHVRYFNVALRVIPRNNVTVDDAKWMMTCMEETGEGVPPPPLNLTAQAMSKSRVKLEWKMPRNINSRFIPRYFVQHSPINRPDRRIVNTTSKGSIPRSYVTGLSSHYIYKFRVAAVNSKHTGVFSEWVQIPLDVKRVVMSLIVVRKSDQIKFEGSLNKILPLSYLGHEKINSTEIRNGNLKIYYNLDFDVNSNISSSKVKTSFEWKWVKELTSYTKRIKVYERNACREDDVKCHAKATCTNMHGTYKCKCPDEMIDTGITGYRFPGLQCKLNTGPPASVSVEVVTPNVVRINIRRPAKIEGNLLNYQVEGRSLSDLDEENILIDVNGKTFSMSEDVGDLIPNSVYEFRARAVTSVKEGAWSPWKRVTTVCYTFEMIFAFTLDEGIDDYQAIRNEAHEKINKYVATKTRPIRVVTVTHHNVTASNFIGDGSVRVQSVIHTKPPAARMDGNDVMLNLQNSLESLFRTGFDTKLGILDSQSVIVTDINECGTKREDCYGNRCINLPGTFTCRCPHGNIDVSADYTLLRGRKCLRFDAPTSFSVSLNDPRTILLSWKLPPDMRKKQLNFWFYVQWRRKGSSASLQSRKVVMDGKNFTSEDFVMTYKVRKLQMNVIYECRVASANNHDNGTFTTWKSVKTSNFIYVAKLNLTGIVYHGELSNSNHPRAVKTAGMVRKLMDRILVNHLQSYMATGKVDFIPGVEDRTFGIANLFFDSKSRVEPQQISHTFKHSTVFEDELRLDTAAIGITDFNECNTTWEDCSAHAQCVNEAPGYKCVCKADYIDRSEHNKLPPGRVCLTEAELTTTPVQTKPTRATFSTRSTPKPPPPLPGVKIYGDAIGPNQLRLTWKRLLPLSGGTEENLNYVFQYRIKGLVEWSKVTAEGFLSHLNIANLRRNILYQVRVAEQWKGKPQVHTSYSFPIQVRTTPKSFRLYLHLPTLAPPGLTSPTTPKQAENAKGIVSDYVQRIFTSDEVLLKHAAVRFGSVGEVGLQPHPGTGSIAFMMIYFTIRSTAVVRFLEKAYKSGEGKENLNWPIHLWKLEDVNECTSPEWNDCSLHADCRNTNGSYECSCKRGFLDGGMLYNFLRGRHCVSLEQTTRTSQGTLPNNIQTLTSTTRRSSTMTEILRSNKPPVLSTSTSRDLKPQTTKQVTVTSQSKQCPRGQRKVNSICRGALEFSGEVVVMEISGVNITHVDAKGESPAKRKIRTALNHVFTSSLGKKKFLDTRVDTLMVRNNLRVAFSLFLELPNNGLRVKRQLFSFDVNDLLKPGPAKTTKLTEIEKTINSRSLRADFKDYLDKLSPLGVVTPKPGSLNSVTFDPKSAVIRDIDECQSLAKMTDCDVKLADCDNSEGSFTCQCKEYTTDLKPERPGRICKRQCETNPCFNDANCLPLKEVGQPFCECTDEYQGEFCTAKKSEASNDNTLMISLLAVAGALFIVLLCLVATCCAHRRNKRIKLQKRNGESIYNHHTLPEEVQQQQPVQTIQPNPRRPYLAKTQVIKRHVIPDDVTHGEAPPHIPTRTTSLKPRPAPRHQSLTAVVRPHARLPYGATNARTASYENTVATSKRTTSQLSSKSSSSFDSDYEEEN